MIFYLLMLSFLAIVALLSWLTILLHPVRSWDFQPVGDDDLISELPSGVEFPPIIIVVPARNEAHSLPKTLPSLLTQDYPAPYHILLIDDRSEDDTANIAKAIAKSLKKISCLTVLNGAPLPKGWTGKVWAMHQGLRAAPTTKLDFGFTLLTDADIEHAPSSLRRLVIESLNGNLALNSRMARLRCVTSAEKLLIPAFIFFFNLLYPMRRVNNPVCSVAAAAGGCMLLSRTTIQQLGGGLEVIRDAIIDDVNLARQIKARGLLIKLALSRNEVCSLREYSCLMDIWKMARRAAFTELKYSWIRLAMALSGLSLLFAIPLAAILSGIVGVVIGANYNSIALSILAIIVGALSLTIMRVVYGPAILFFKLPARYAYTLPIAGLLYGLMTLDSALRHARGADLQWRAPTTLL